MRMKTRFLKSTMTLCLCFTSSLLLIELGYPQDIDIAKYPNRPITFVDPFSAGGSSDLAIRLLGKEVEKYLGQPIIVVNKPGGGGTIGVSAIASAKPDGYTIGQSVGGAPMFILPFLEKVPYHPIKDLKQIIQYSAPNFGVVVKGDSPFKSFKDLITYSYQNPKKVTYGTNAPNSIANLIMEQIAKKDGVQLTHIPFKASPEYQTALLGGHVLFTAGDFAFPLVEAGQTRILLFLLEKRSDDYPQVPILKDFGYDVSVPVMFTVTAPKSIPDEIAKKLEEAFTKAIKEPAFLKGMRDLHMTIIYRNSRETADYVAYNYEAFGKLLKEIGLVK